MRITLPSIPAIVFLVCACLPTSSIAGGSVFGSARITAAFYGDTLEEQQSDLYSNLLLKVRDDSGFSINVSGRLKASMTTDTSEDWNIYSSSLAWTLGGRRLSAIIGRRLMFSGVIRGVRDGVELRLSRILRPTDLNILLFAGKRASRGLDPEPLVEDEDLTLGFAAGARLINSLTVKLSTDISLEDRTDYRDLMGFQCEWVAARGLELDGGLEYDLATERTDRTFVRANFSTSNFSSCAEYLFRESAWIPESSWYSIFADLLDPCTQYKLSMEYAAVALDSLTAGFCFVSGDHEHLSVSGYLAAWKRLRFGYRYSGDDAIARGGVFGSFRQSFSEAWSVDAGVDLSRHTVYELYDLPSYGSHLRITYNPDAPFRLFSEVQHRKNRVMDNDVRAYVGAGYRLQRAYGPAARHLGGDR